MIALLLTDEKPGHENQSRALCDGMGLTPVKVKTVYASRGAKACSYLLGRLGVYTASLYAMDPLKAIVALGLQEKPACVIGAGSNTFYALKVVSRALGIPAVAILTPKGYRLDGYRAILAPAFDLPPPRENVIPVPVNITPAREAFYQEKTAEFLKRYTPVKSRAVGISVGGPNGFADITPEWMREQLEKIFAATPDCEHWITTSRRTPEAVDAVIDSFPFDYKLIFRRDTFNPIPAFVTRCERLFVTAESTGMVSEAVTQGNATVEILMNINNTTSKFARFIQQLSEAGYVHVFDGSLGVAQKKVVLQPIYDEVRKRLAR